MRKKRKKLFSARRWSDPPVYSVVGESKLTKEDEEQATQWREKLKEKGIVPKDGKKG